MAKQRMQPLRAWRALRRLIADPEQTQEVFNVIEALSGPALEKGYHRFAKTRVGMRVLNEEIDLLDTLSDRTALAATPRDSLAQHYLKFVTTENLTADGLVEASDVRGQQELPDGLARFGARQRDMHDLWHTLTQYGRDELGEACLLAFTYAQTQNRGIGIICLAGIHEFSKVYGRGAYSAAWAAYQDGKRAAWLPGEDWEHLLTLPIDKVRQQLNINEPTPYWDLRNADMAAA